MVRGSAHGALHARGSAAISQLWLDRISIQGKRWAEDKSLMTEKRSHCTVSLVTCEVLLWQVTSRRLSDPDRDVASHAVVERLFT